MNRRLLLKTDRFGHSNDPWFCYDGEVIHAFLQGINAAHDPADQRYEGGIAHFTSRDGLRWMEHTPVLTPGEPGSDDDAPPLNSGSTLYHEGRFYLFYTGWRLDENRNIERIFVATSEDGYHFTRHAGNPILVPDNRWYETLPHQPPNGQVNWRDPDVIHCSEDGKFYLVHVARTADHQAVLGLAVSENLLDWESLPPCYVNPRSDIMVCPHWMRIGGRYYICYSQWLGSLSAQGKREMLPENLETGMWYISADHPQGPWNDEDRRALIGSRLTSCHPYSGAPLVVDGDTFFSYNVSGSPAYAPFKRVVAEQGRLSLRWNESLESVCGPPVPIVPDFSEPAGVGYRFSLSPARGRDGLISGTIVQGEANRAGILFRADDQGWEGFYLAWNFETASVEFGAESHPGSLLLSRAAPEFAGESCLNFRLLMLEDLLEFYVEDRLVFTASTCLWKDQGHEQMGVVEVGGDGGFEHLEFRAISMSSGTRW